MKNYFFAIRNLIYISIKGQTLKYFRTERYIIGKLREFDNSKILLISGGRSIHKYWDIVKSYDYLALNSYNSFNCLTDEQKQEIKDKVIVYYQAPYHKPLNMNDYNNNIDNTINSLNEKCIVIHNKNGRKNIVYDSDRIVNFRLFSNLELVGFKFVYSSGFLTLLNLLVTSGFKKIDILGVDLDFYKTETFSSMDEFVTFNIGVTEIFFNLRHFKKNILTKKSVSVTNINPESFYNLK